MTSKEYYYSMLQESERELFSYLPTINELVALAKDRYFEELALDGIAGPMTYRSLLDRVASLRGFFRDLGIQKGSHIGFQLPNNATAAALFLAITTYGCVAVPFPMTMMGEELGDNLKKMDITLFLYADMLEQRLKLSVLPEGMTVKKESEITDAEPCPEAAVEKDTPAAIFFTGGTTGKSKGALLSHGALMRGAFNGIFAPAPALKQRYLAIIPFSHVFGVVRNLLTCFYTGSMLYTCEDMRAVVSILPKAKPTLLVLVPALADLLLGLATMRGTEALGGQLKIIICGAAQVPEHLVFRYKQLGISLCPGYGMTETANLISGNGIPEKKPTSVGMPYMEQEVKIVDNEIRVRGDHLMLCYYNDPEETANVFEDGWIKTGDLGRFDEDGFLYITGRSKNIIVLPNGENVSPEELELMLVRIPLIKDALVRERVLEGAKHILEAEVLPNMPACQKMGITDVEGSIRAAIDKLNASLPPYKVLSRIVFRTEDFPRTPSMKIVRS